MPTEVEQHSQTLLVAELPYTPINDASFMEEEQSNGNLCCIESAKENACQISDLLLWTLRHLVPSRSGIEEGKELKTVRGHHCPTHGIPTPSPVPYHVITPTFPGDDTATTNQ